MKLFGDQLRLLIASVARTSDLIPRNNRQIDQLLMTFFKKGKLPIRFNGEEPVEESAELEKEVEKKIEEVKFMQDGEYEGKEIDEILNRDTKVNANLESFKNLLSISMAARYLRYLGDTSSAQLDSKVFSCNRDNLLIQDIFNLAEIKWVKKLRAFALDSCENVVKFYLPPNIFNEWFCLMKQSPVTLRTDSPTLTAALETIVSEDLFTENQYFVMVRLLLDKPLKTFRKKMSRLKEVRQEQLDLKNPPKKASSTFGFSFPDFSSIISGAANLLGSNSKVRSMSHDITEKSEKDNPATRVSSEGDDDTTPPLKQYTFQKEEEKVIKSSTMEEKTLADSKVTSEGEEEPCLNRKMYNGPQRTLELSFDKSPAHLAEFLGGWADHVEAEYFENIIIHMHGGGFMAMTSSSHQVYLRKWAKHLGVPVFSVEYRLAPQTQFPFVVNDVIRSYLWILFFLEKIIKAKVKKIILAGDSAGGNLAIGLTMWCIENGIRRPDLLHIHYPAVSLSNRTFSPSFMYSMDDYFLNFSVLKGAIEVYVPKYVNPHKNYYVSPLFAPGEILAKMPLVEMFVCERDPLRDDDLRFALKLLNLGVKVKIVYYKYVTHGVLSLSMRFGLPEAQHFEKTLRASLQGYLVGWKALEHLK